LWYHLTVLRRDGSARHDALEARHSDFDVLVLDNSNGELGTSIKTLFARHASKIPLTVLNAAEKIPPGTNPKAVILPGSLSVNAPENIESWLRSFNGSRLIIPDESAGVFWVNDLGQAVTSIRALAEGQSLHPQSTRKSASAWTYVAYVFAALFALQLLFFLLMLGVSLVAGD